MANHIDSKAVMHKRLILKLAEMDLINKLAIKNKQEMVWKNELQKTRKNFFQFTELNEKHKNNRKTLNVFTHDSLIKTLKGQELVEKHILDVKQEVAKVTCKLKNNLLSDLELGKLLNINQRIKTHLKELQNDKEMEFVSILSKNLSKIKLKSISFKHEVVNSNAIKNIKVSEESSRKTILENNTNELKIGTVFFKKNFLNQSIPLSFEPSERLPNSKLLENYRDEFKFNFSQKGISQTDIIQTNSNLTDQSKQKKQKFQNPEFEEIANLTLKFDNKTQNDKSINFEELDVETRKGSYNSSFSNSSFSNSIFIDLKYPEKQQNNSTSILKNTLLKKEISSALTDFSEPNTNINVNISYDS